MREARVEANGIKFSYLEEGEGPLVLLLHGFPDTARSWSHQMRPLAEAGFRAVAPWLRGYPPTDIPREGFYDRGTLAVDIRELVRALGGGKPVHLVAQDWGALISYNVLAAFPELIGRAVVMAIPHPNQVRKTLLVPKHVHRSFHWWFFQLPQLPEAALAANDFAFIDYLWDYWTAPGYKDEAHLAEIKRMLAEPGAVTATLAYYRAMFDPAKCDPLLEEVRQAIERPITVPTLALCGADDLRAEVMPGQEEFFAGEYRYELVPASGHFLHRENPEMVTRLVLDWLARG
jgi:pimeloyl-ACP methyl ester carboxylesterase